MEQQSFREKMLEVDQSFGEERFEDSLSAAQAITDELMELEVLEAEMLCWPLYYELRALHALKRWSEVTSFMKDRSAVLTVIGPQNMAYAYSLTMESAAQAGEVDELPDLAYWCFYYRLSDGDHESLQLAISTSKQLLQLFDRAELFPLVLDKLAEAAVRFEDIELSDFARQWADKERTDLSAPEGPSENE